MERMLRPLPVVLLAASLTYSEPTSASEIYVRAERAEEILYPEYFCTNRGVRVEVEDHSCLDVDGHGVVAKCDISLNDPMWRSTGKSCQFDVTSDFLPVIAN